jgi:ubiquinone/menaquinone biosynthesis C-methylase UbiE
MEFGYQQSDVHRRYDFGRALEPEATRALMELIRGHAARPVRLVVDLGCGTGLFTAALAEAFNAPVVGVEPAANMRAAAEAKPHPATVRFVPGWADHIPLEDGAADLIFMSQVLHHIGDRPRALSEVHRALRPRGRLCIRQTTQENLDSYFYQRFFPEARAIDEGRLPSRGGLLRLANSCRYRKVAVETLRHEIAATSSDYVAKIGLRTYSDLECIPDAAFRKGLEALRAYCAAHPDHSRFAEDDLFILEREEGIGDGRSSPRRCTRPAGMLSL